MSTPSTNSSKKRPYNTGRFSAGKATARVEFGATAEEKEHWEFLARFSGVSLAEFVRQRLPALPTSLNPPRPSIRPRGGIA